MRLNEIRNKIYITGYTCACRVLRKTTSSHIKEILVIDSGRIGDSIMFLGALHALEKTYGSSVDYRITLVCRKDMQGFLQENLGDSIRLFPVEILDVWPEFREFKRLVDSLRKISFYKCIVMMSHGWGDYLAYCIFAEQKSTVCLGKRGKFLRKYILSHGYHISENCQGDLFLPRAAARLMEQIGCGDYMLQKEKIKCVDNSSFTINQKYIIIAPMANVPHRNLSLKQSISIAKYILQNTHFGVLFIGRSNDVKYINDVIRDCNDKRCMNYAGKTDFDAFVHLIAKSEFIVSADSGQVHIAAAVDVPSVCLVGYQDKGRFLPYDYEQKSACDPLCIYSKEPRCQHCIDKGRSIGSGNRECKKRIKAGLPVLCLEKIDMNDVYKAIDVLVERRLTSI